MPKLSIVGKYEVIQRQHVEVATLHTDNPREAIWEANKCPLNIPINICGDVDFYKTSEGWRFRRRNPGA